MLKTWSNSSAQHSSKNVKMTLSAPDRSFTWIHVYGKIARQLINYRDRQQDLIVLLNDIHNKTRIRTVLQDAPYVIHKQIDPFSFFMNFNRAGLSDNERRTMIGEIQNSFSLSKELPDDFKGTFSSSTAQKWAHYFHHINKENATCKNHVENLWEIASRALYDKVSDALFAYCLEFPNVGVGGLTQGLYWFNPAVFFPIDSKSLQYLPELLIGMKDIREYLQVHGIYKNILAKGKRSEHEIEYVQAYRKILMEVNVLHVGRSFPVLFHQSQEPCQNSPNKSSGFFHAPCRKNTG